MLMAWHAVGTRVSRSQTAVGESLHIYDCTAVVDADDFEAGANATITDIKGSGASISERTSQTITEVTSMHHFLHVHVL